MSENFWLATILLGTMVFLGGTLAHCLSAVREALLVQLQQSTQTLRACLVEIVDGVHLRGVSEGEQLESLQNWTKEVFTEMVHLNIVKAAPHSAPGFMQQVARKKEAEKKTSLPPTGEKDAWPPKGTTVMKTSG